MLVRSYELPGLVASQLGMLISAAMAITPRQYGAVQRFNAKCLPGVQRAGS